MTPPIDPIEVQEWSAVELLEMILAGVRNGSDLFSLRSKKQHQDGLHQFTVHKVTEL
jgi:hypothetical protein